MLVTPPLALYVHFPWCVRKCPYCDFNSHTLHGPLAESAYIAALEADLAAQAAEVDGREVRSIFFGGGTPSLFSPSALDRLLSSIRATLIVAADAEVTLEANPGTIERGRFAEYRAAGINRVSLGAQSFAARQLAALGRIHSADETRTAANELHAAGLENFNIDLMYALPGQTTAEALDDLDSALALAPAHVSHYQLTLEPGTVFAAQPPQLPDDDVAAEMLDVCRERLADAAFARYEISAYASAGRRCSHNVNYWAFGDYLGLGAGAHGKVSCARTGAVVRTARTRDPRRYSANIAGTLKRQPVPAEELPFEFMLNALRLVEGFAPSLFTQRTGLPWSRVARQIDALEARELLIVEEARIRPSSRGLRFLNDLLLSFLAEKPKTNGGFGLSTAV
ncbi:MAG TPA: radical SAM family heme chaperone HemW [Steroidobacteraceae bacterium]|nr:radical SAM family heme chaperone HemW [Steroidobacteraceae bacterium]